MIKTYIVPVIILILLSPLPSRAQIEPVRSDHPVYDFLTRMEVKQVLPHYHGTVIPISRDRIAGYLAQLQENRGRLTNTERQLLDSYRIEFAYDLNYTGAYTTQLFGRNGISETLSGMPSHKQRYLYAYADTSRTTFL